MSEFEMTDVPRHDRDEFETLLGSLQPRCQGIGRDQLMYLAGQRAAAGVPRERGHRGRALLWPLSTAASWLVTATVLGIWLSHGDLSGSGRTVLTTEGAGSGITAPAQRLATGNTARHNAVAENDAAKENRDARIRQSLDHRRTPSWRSSAAPPIGRILEGDLAGMGLSRLGRGAGDASSRRDLPAAVIPRDPAEAPATYATLLEEYLTNSRTNAITGAPL